MTVGIGLLQEAISRLRREALVWPARYGICSRTRPLEAAAEDLAYLSTLPQQTPGARVYGRVTQSRREPLREAWIDYGPLENVVINLRGTSFSRDVSTDKNGRYEFSGVPSGTVSLTLVSPTGFDIRHLEQEIEIRDESRLQCARLSTAADRARIGNGRRLGRTSSGWHPGGCRCRRTGRTPAAAVSRPAKTDDRGRFEFDDLPPGVYVGSAST